MGNTYDFDLNLDVARKITHLIHSVFPRISHFPLIAMFDQSGVMVDAALPQDDTPYIPFKPDAGFQQSFRCHLSCFFLNMWLGHAGDQVSQENMLTKSFDKNYQELIALFEVQRSFNWSSNYPRSSTLDLGSLLSACVRAHQPRPALFFCDKMDASCQEDLESWMGVAGQQRSSCNPVRVSAKLPRKGFEDNSCGIRKFLHITCFYSQRWDEGKLHGNIQQLAMPALHSLLVFLCFSEHYERVRLGEAG